LDVLDSAPVAVVKQNGFPCSLFENKHREQITKAPKKKRVVFHAVVRRWMDAVRRYIWLAFTVGTQGQNVLSGCDNVTEQQEQVT
jgi:hypothetical protein